MNKSPLRPILIVSVLLLALSSCSLILTPSINPPSWIIGTWSDDYEINTYTFSSNNIFFSTGGTSISFKDAVLASSFDELINNSTQYKVQLSEGGLITTMNFVKTSTTTLNYSIGSVTIELIKD